MGIFYKAIAAVVVGLALSIIPLQALADMVIDASDIEAFDASVEGIREDLTLDQRLLFDEELQNYMLQEVMRGLTVTEFGALSDEELQARSSSAIASLHGVHASELIGVSVEQLSAPDHLSGEDGLIIQRADFYFREGLYKPNPVIEINAFNNTQHAISKVYFNGVLKSPDRSVPWVDENFSYSIAGGIEPGESLNWKLSPNNFGPWANSSIPDDAVLELEVTRAEDAEGAAVIGQ